MANRNFSATISIGAKLEQSFKGVFGGVKRDIQELGKSLASAKSQRDLVSGVLGARSKFNAANQSLTDAQESIRLSQLYGDKSDVRNSKKLEAAAMKLALAERRALNEITAQAKAAGINVKKLTEEERKATEQLTKLEGEMQRLQQRSDRIDSVGRVFRRVGDAAQHVGQRFERAGSAFGAARNRMLLFTAAATAAGYAVYKLTRGFIDAEDNLGDTAEALNITTGSLKQWQVMAATVGIGDEKLNKSFAKFSASIEEGSEKTINVLNELGISQAKLKTLPLGQQIAIVADKFKNYTGKMNQAAMVQALFGKGASNLATVFHMGRAEWDGYLDRAKKLGYLLDKEGNDKVGAMAASMDTLDLAMKGARNTIALGLAPAVTRVGEAISNFIEQHHDDLARWATELGQNLEKELLPAVKEFLVNLPSAAQKFGEFAGGVWKVVTAVRDLAGGWGALAGVLTIANFTPVFAAFGPWGLAVEAVSIAVIALYNNWDKVQAKVAEWGKATADVIREVAAIFRQIWGPEFDWLEGKFKAIGSFIKTWVIDPFLSFADKLEKLIPDVSKFLPSAPTSGPGANYMGMAGITGAGLISQDQMRKLAPVVGPTTNNVSVTVNAPGASGDEIARKLRDNLRRQPLFDSNYVLAPQ